MLSPKHGGCDHRTRLIAKETGSLFISLQRPPGPPRAPFRIGDGKHEMTAAGTGCNYKVFECGLFERWPLFWLQGKRLALEKIKKRSRGFWHGPDHAEAVVASQTRFKKYRNGIKAEGSTAHPPCTPRTAARRPPSKKSPSVLSIGTTYSPTPSREP